MVTIDNYGKLLVLTQLSAPVTILGYPGYYPAQYGGYAQSPGVVGQYAPSPGNQFAPMHSHPGNEQKICLDWFLSCLDDNNIHVYCMK